MRKETGLEYTDRIQFWISGTDRVRRVLESDGAAGMAVLAAEVLALEVFASAPSPGAVGAHGAHGDAREVDVEGESVCLWVVRA